MSIAAGDKTREHLRDLIVVIERELAGTKDTALRGAWDDFVTTLALGPAPELRECPKCGAVGMRLARRCGTCWVALEPLPPLESKPAA